MIYPPSIHTINTHSLPSLGEYGGGGSKKIGLVEQENGGEKMVSAPELAAFFFFSFFPFFLFSL